MKFDWSKLSKNQKGMAIGAVAVVGLGLAYGGAEEEAEYYDPYGQGQPYQEGGGYPPEYGYPPESGYPPAGGSGGGSGGGSEFDMDEWREQQERDDERQRQEIDVIREVERCYNPETGEVVEVPDGLADQLCE